LKAVWWTSPSDVIAGATSTTGTTGNDKIDLSHVTTPSASIYGLAGDDVILGGSGDDWIVGGKGSDVLTGNGGHDSFVFALGDGQDQITDFVPGFDRVLFQGVTQANLHASWATVGAVQGMMVSYGSGTDQVFLARVGSLTSNSIFLS
jgi:Ca2+-binding RTX toxin-like protein